MWLLSILKSLNSLGHTSTCISHLYREEKADWWSSWNLLTVSETIIISVQEMWIACLMLQMTVITMSTLNFTTTESSSQDSMFNFETGSPSFYVVVGVGSMMMLLIIILSIMVFLLLSMLYNHYSHRTMHGKLHTILIRLTWFLAMQYISSSCFKSRKWC